MTDIDVSYTCPNLEISQVWFATTISFLKVNLQAQNLSDYIVSQYSIVKPEVILTCRDLIHFSLICWNASFFKFIA